jgi:hypothetical protein
MRRRSPADTRHPAANSHRAGDPQELRLRVAAEATRLMTESGLRDYQFAKRKAAERLGVFDDFALPKNSEVEAALREHQRLFRAEDQPKTLRSLRATAVEAMRFFAAFEPRLVGAVLEGTADEYSAVCLHLFSDDPDAPARFLDEQGIQFDEQTRRLRVTRDVYAEFPALEFAVDTTTIDLTIFELDDLRQAPLDRIDAKPMRRATLAALQQLLDAPDVQDISL